MSKSHKYVLFLILLPANTASAEYDLCETSFFTCNNQCLDNSSIGGCGYFSVIDDVDNIFHRQHKSFSRANKLEINKFRSVKAYFTTRQGWQYFLFEKVIKDLNENKIFGECNFSITHEEATTLYERELHEISVHLVNYATESCTQAKK